MELKKLSFPVAEDFSVELKCSITERSQTLWVSVNLWHGDVDENKILNFLKKESVILKTNEWQLKKIEGGNASDNSYTTLIFLKN